MTEIEGARPEGDRAQYGVLVVDDEEAILESIEMTLGSEYRLFTATNGDAALEILDRESIALVISDQVMPGMTGVEFLERVVEKNPKAIRMMLTGYADMSSLIRAINEGRIYRYISKPWEPDALRVDVRRALDAYALASRNVELAADLEAANERLRAENLYLRREVEGRYSFSEMIGESAAMQKVFDITHKVAETDATVLITGETGTGKDLIARAIHYTGPRKEARFVAQNCAALPETLLESELFGHRRGAFTGAHADKKGLFELANGGTIFLDEIGETDPSMQVRLLRVLQDGEIRPLGSSETVQCSVRVVAATHREIRREVEEGRFREDLYYRMRVVEIRIPPLRERREDVPLLAHHFLDKVSPRMGRKLTGFTNAAMDRLIDYEWPGNVRELENEIERISALAGHDDEAIGAEMLSEHIRGTGSDSAIGVSMTPAVPGRDMNRAVDELKRDMIIESMRLSGSKTRAAERLGIPRQSLQKMIKRLEITQAELAPVEK
ncbi:sigma-54 dependent transcriptional regulator [Myxococcota bacterium]|nr:sigma-54 dependent transcriptional regulator [Myxococcota bacterium]